MLTIEYGGGYKRWLHGEAVALGIIAAVHYGIASSICDPLLLNDIIDLFRQTGLPVSLSHPDRHHSQPDPDQIVAAMYRDKKTRSGRIRLIIPETAGSVVAVDRVNPDRIRDAFVFLKQSR